MNSMPSGKTGNMACEPLNAVYKNHFFGQIAGL
jgi:hypothetical protein